MHTNQHRRACQLCPYSCECSPPSTLLTTSSLLPCSDGRDEEAQLKDRLQNTVSRLETLPCSDGSPEARAFWANLLRTTFLSPAAGQVSKEEQEERLQETWLVIPC